MKEAGEGVKPPYSGPMWGDTPMSELMRRCADEPSEIPHRSFFLAVADALDRIVPGHTHPSEFDIALVGCPACDLARAQITDGRLIVEEETNG